MYAIVEIAGQQFKVEKDQKVFVHRLKEDEGKKLSFDNVLLLDNGGAVTVGAPAIDGAFVEAKVLRHLKGDKVIVFKKKRRKGYRVKNGHRQALSEIQIEGINATGAKKVSKKEAAPKQVAPTETAKTAAPVAESTSGDLSKMTVAQLKEMAKAKGIEGISSMKKADLIAALS
jgi:large subunit ribosomal protein L21